MKPYRCLVLAGLTLGLNIASPRSLCAFPAAGSGESGPTESRWRGLRAVDAHDDGPGPANNPPPPDVRMPPAARVPPAVRAAPATRLAAPIRVPAPALRLETQPSPRATATAAAGFPRPRREFGVADVDAVMGESPTLRDGVFLQIFAGPAFTHLVASGTGSGGSVSALGLGVMTAVGGWVSANLVLGGQIAASSALGPRFDGTAVAAPRGPAALTTVSGGASLSYILDQDRGKLALALTYSQVRLVDRTSGQIISGTGFGPGVEIGASRDWRVGGGPGDEEANAHEPDWTRGWTLGAALRISVSRQHDMKRALSFVTIGAVAALTASYD